MNIAALGTVHSGSHKYHMQMLSQHCRRLILPRCALSSAGLARLVACIIAIGSTGLYGELIYDAPYFSREAIRFNLPKPELSDALNRSDVVFLGKTSQIDKSRYDDNRGVGYYSSLVQISEILKGSVRQPSLSVSWKPSATNIEENSRHIFLATEMKGKLKVNKEIYIYDRIPWCRTYGAYNGGLESTLGTLKFLIHPEVGWDSSLTKTLLEDIRSKEIQKQGTAVLLMHELSRPECTPALTYDVENMCDGYLTASCTLCKLDGTLGARTVIRLLLSKPDLNRWTQASLFAAMTTAGNKAAVDQIREFGNSYPQFRVSCAFAIKDLAPDRLREISAHWIEQAKTNHSEEIISDGSISLTYPTVQLLEAANSGKLPAGLPLK